MTELRLTRSIKYLDIDNYKPDVNCLKTAKNLLRQTNGSIKSMVLPNFTANVWCVWYQFIINS